MQNNIVKLILEIEKRPAMYIGRNSIFCLKAFLDGWHFRNPKQTDNSEILIEFKTGFKQSSTLIDIAFHGINCYFPSITMKKWH